MNPTPPGTAFLQVITLVRDLGFPIAVAIYLLVRLDLLIRDNTAALGALTTAVTALPRCAGGG